MLETQANREQNPCRQRWAFPFIVSRLLCARAQGVVHVCTLEWMTCEIQVFRLGAIYHLSTMAVTTERNAAVWFVAMYACTAHH